MESANKYYRDLGLIPGANLAEIKKAYRQYAKKYHPDLNSSKSASDIFIRTTEAYQFLLAHKRNLQARKESVADFINEWESYRKEQARRRAREHAKKRYSNFVKSDLYKSTKMLDRIRIYISMAFSVLIIVMSVYGYIYRLSMVDLGFEKPTLGGFIFLLMVGILFLTTSLVFLYHNHIKPKRKVENAEKSKQPL
ncbi:MAG: DnaJ domain-containing protein [Bacteroidales bacterium]|nr:DnaJ domain-containing protein [Bacteroidales bacterium]